MNPRGVVALELGDGQAGPVAALFEGNMWVVDGIIPDYSGRQRVIVARPAGEADASDSRK